MQFHGRNRVKVLNIILLLFIAFQVHAKDSARVPSSQAVSDKKVALVIGNSAYLHSPLKNPVNDAADITAKLRRLGFDVIERSNLQTRQIGGTLREFRSKLVPGVVAMVFYAGHGLQIKGENYLPAVDANINSEEDVPNQSLSVKQLMDVLDESRTRLNLVFLDACRNNPYARSFRSSDRGLARISAPSGTLISYATKPGSVAADGDGRNGLYTSKLLAYMVSNEQIEQTLKRVVSEVKAASQGKQEPWMEGSIEGNFCFAGCDVGGSTQVTNTVPAPVAVKSREQIEDDTWKTAEDINSIDAYETYLSTYAKGRYAAQARMKLSALKKAAVSTTAAQIQQQQTATWLESQKQEAERKRQEAELPKGYVKQGGLTWMPVSSTTYTYADASALCAGTINGQSGWRLPNKEELVSLHDSGTAKGQGWTFGLTWSSEPESAGTHYLVSPGLGYSGWNFDTSSNYVSCVRA